MPLVRPRQLFFCEVENALPGGEPYALPGPRAAVDIMSGIVNPFSLEELVDRGRGGFAFFNHFFHIDRLIAKLPEMMFRIVLIAVGEKLELPHQPFLTGLIGVFGYSPEQLFG